MKKLIALLLVLALAVSISACGEDPSATTDTTETTEATQPKEGVYIRDSYSVTDEKAQAQRDTVIANVGEAQLTNGLLQVYYWLGIHSFISEQGYYIYYYGLDPSTGLDLQNIPGGEGTWQQLFLDQALANWHRHQALAQLSEHIGLPMDPDYQKILDGLRESLEESAKKNKHESAEAMIRHDLGSCVTVEDYIAFQQGYYTYRNFYDYLLEQSKVTDEDVEKYFTENEEALKEKGITKETLNYGVRHILVEITGGTKDENGKTTYSDADWEACRASAQALLDQWLAGEATEETFAAMAKEHSADPGSKDKGGLYEGLDKNTNFVEPFKQWYLDEARKVGDYGLVKTDYGYHIMYMSSAEPIWADHCRDILMYNESAAFINAALEDHPMETDYEKIVLGVVKLNGI